MSLDSVAVLSSRMKMSKKKFFLYTISQKSAFVRGTAVITSEDITSMLFTLILM